jgi:hypothetical protein
MVAGVSEEAVHNVTLSAGEVPDLGSNLIDRLVQYCVDHHRTKDLSALADPIPREVMLRSPAGDLVSPDLARLAGVDGLEELEILRQRSARESRDDVPASGRGTPPRRA